MSERLTYPAATETTGDVCSNHSHLVLLYLEVGQGNKAKIKVTKGFQIGKEERKK